MAHKHKRLVEQHRFLCFFDIDKEYIRNYCRCLSTIHAFPSNKNDKI